RRPARGPAARAVRAGRPRSGRGRAPLHRPRRGRGRHPDGAPRTGPRARSRRPAAARGAGADGRAARTVRFTAVPALVLKNGLIADGSTTPAFAGDVAIDGDRIVEVGGVLSGTAEIDCTGHVVAPGFIDPHSHSDIRVLAEPDLPMKLRQGITLEVFGQDGISVAPVRPEDQQNWKQKLS